MTPLEFAAKRHALGIGQGEAAKQLGVNRRTITRWEKDGTPSTDACDWIKWKYGELIRNAGDVVANGGRIDTNAGNLDGLTEPEKLAYISASVIACDTAGITPIFH